MKAKEMFTESIAQKENFWAEQAEQIEWFKKPTQILTNDGVNYPTWFADGELNTCFLAVDKHVKDGFGDQIAIIYDSPVTNRIFKYTYNQVLEHVSKFAGGLKKLGLETGDTAIIYMPMIPESVFAMLACARLGVTHSVVFGGFAPQELAIRIDDCQPKAIITASSGMEVSRRIPYLPFVKEAITMSEHQPNHIIAFDRKLLGNRVDFKSDPTLVDFEKLMTESEPTDCVSVKSTHPLYILYTSGTTGKPKGVVRDNGGHAVAMKFSMQNIYGAKEGETFWAASDIGWAVGHSYSVYGPLINRNTTIIFEGKPIGTPDAGTFWRVIEEHKVSVMFTAPTAIRAIKKEDPDGNFVKKYDLSSLRTQFLAGERCDVATLDWYDEFVGVPAIDHWWQTESGSPMLGLMPGIEDVKIKRASAGKPIPGYDIKIFSEEGYELESHHEGYLVIKLPLAPGAMMGIWGDPERFKFGYLSRFPGYYFSGDGAIKDEDGYVFVTGRVDDVINVAGHRLSTSEMEEVVSGHKEVAECCVVGIDDDLKGQVPFAIAVLKSGSKIDEKVLEKEIVLLIREKIGAVASMKNAMVVNRLPKTRSGKILRKLIRTMLDGKDYQMPSTIDDESIVEELQVKMDEYKL
ncbi:AMP-binding protein [Frigoriflavimonas asaccharolytica]|uniref:Propionyl-CoA synthetase n=1 Tax=Frigoriflavimonas asaccharolytica TaxID=2735899 RepID=A0A8J8G6J7_9FLAO|nr:AMP-binding protein [Frigoriflavimonas asaccharolytica]NRS92078.1 propionyl-CoA synthetase [Frigoriflavimonas asaccharolytica]